ncbi:MAG: hypothetical protein QNJ08_17970, partial [Crocosphaera sp.]|nr:hypothetical protein [Crocosphaera sp.]
MRCVKCGKNSNYKQRIANNSYCYNCGHPFAFEPSEMKKIITFTDPFFASVLSDISAHNTLYFTSKQFHYFFNKKLKLKAINRENRLIIILVLFIFFIIISEFLKSTYSKEIGDITSFLFTLLAIGSFYFIVANQVKTQTNQIFIVSLEEMNQCLNRWQEINASLSYLLSSPNTEQFNPINLGTNAYSFDRAIICDKSEIAQFLIKNNFHFENNCAVLSIDG